MRVGVKCRACVNWKIQTTDYRPFKTLMEVQSSVLSSLFLVPDRIGLIKHASPIRVRGSFKTSPFLTLHRGAEGDKQQETQLLQAVWRQKMNTANWSSASSCWGGLLRWSRIFVAPSSHSGDHLLLLALQKNKHKVKEAGKTVIPSFIQVFNLSLDTV